MKISVSQIKKFAKSPSQWAGQYILWIKDEFSSDAMDIGTALHSYIETWSKGEAYNKLLSVDNKEKAVEQLDILIKNLEEFEIPQGERELKCNGKLFWFDCVGYIDLLTDDEAIDFKTVSSLSKPDDNPWMWQRFNNYEEYKLQAYFYMIATWRKKARILELMKKEFKTKKVPWQWIEFNLEDIEKEVTEKWKPYVEDMYNIYNLYPDLTK